MEEKHQKPLRPSSNKIKDLYNTYIKNDEPRNMSKESTEKMNEKLEKELEDKIEAALQKDANIENEETEYILSQERHIPISDNESLDYQSIIEVLNQEINSYKKQISNLEEELNSNKEQLIRRTAEMENLRRRTLKEKQELIEYGNEKLLTKFVEIPDDFANAIDAAKKATDKESLIIGLELIQTKVIKLFEEAGVTPLPNPVGQEFDVNLHDALMASPSDLPEGYVVQVLQNGYMLNDKVIRHTKVITSSGN